MIRHGLSHKSAVQLTVFNTLVPQVAVLQNGEQEVGYHEFNFEGSGRSSGCRRRPVEIIITQNGGPT